MKQLEKSYQEQIKLVGKTIMSFQWHDPLAYAQWLGQTYHYASTTTRLLMLAGAHVSMEKQKLHLRFLDHTREERGHEKLLTNDLKAIGYSLTDVPELTPTAGLYQSQYYWIQNRSPMAFFGYIIILEGIAAVYGSELCKKVTDAHGAKAATFLKVHSEEDIGHVEKAMAEIAQFDQSVQHLVIENLGHSAQFYNSMLLESQAVASKKGKAAA